jgi:alginate O-acetyltransferase complex protein AlgI
VLFSEPAFLFYFLPAILVLHSLAPRAARNPLLLAASLIFYAWGEPRHVLLLLVSIALNYVAGLGIAAAAGRGRSGRGALAAGVAGNLLLLGFFKYAGFVGSLVGLGFRGPALPIGISFFTFQALSYLVDVQRGHARPQRNLLTLALYISMFPQLIAGPIVRYRDVEHQLTDRHIDRAGFAEGVRRFVLGLSKKMLIANSVALPADRIFALPTDELNAGLSWLAITCYTAQIYFDFSGYSDMAIGLGRMFGLRFLENFDHPYESRSVREFWRRWHISLSTWFRDYLYLPLGGSRKSPARVALNLWIVFLLCGLWHGASWNFVVWGAFHGLFLSLERTLLRARVARLPALPARAYTLLVVMVGWVWFRAETLAGSVAMLRALVGFGTGDGVVHNVALFADMRVWLALGAAALGATSIPARLARRVAAGLPERTAPVEFGARATALAGLTGLLVVCLSVVASDTYNPFIYFRF